MKTNYLKNACLATYVSASLALSATTLPSCAQGTESSLEKTTKECVVKSTPQDKSDKKYLCYGIIAGTAIGLIGATLFNRNNYPDMSDKY